MIEVKIILASNISRCPKKSLLAAHYSPDGSCKCADRSRIAEELAEAHAVAASAQATVRQLSQQLRET